MQLPAIKEKQKIFWPLACCYLVGPPIPLRLVVRVPVSGYTPGQTMNIEIDVDNQSAKDAHFDVELLKVMNCLSQIKYIPHPIHKIIVDFPFCLGHNLSHLSE